MTDKKKAELWAQKKILEEVDDQSCIVTAYAVRKKLKEINETLKVRMK